MLAAFINWLSNTPASNLIDNHYWIVPAVQAVHILGIAAIMSSILMIDLRLLGVAGRSQSIPDVAHRFMPWVWGALVVLASTGIILIIGSPHRELDSNVFRLKMVLLACAVCLMGTFQIVANRRAQYWESRPVISRITGAVSIMLFVFIVITGRWIAYWAH